MFIAAGSIAIALVVLALGTLLSAVFLWLAMRILHEDGTFVALIVASVISSVVNFILSFFNGFLGAVAGFIVLLVLITKFTSAGGFSAFLMVIISGALAFGITLGVIVMFGG